MIKTIAIMLLAATSACRDASENPTPPTQTDSVYAREVAGFLAASGLAPAGLQGAAPSRAGLVQRFALALESHDTASLRQMVLTRAEFAHLYYPHTRFTAPPYRMAPGLLWFLIQNNSSKGITRVYQRYAGKPLGPVHHECEGVERQGGITLWTGCVLIHGAAGSVRRERWFGSIMERAGAFKFVSYANDL